MIRGKQMDETTQSIVILGGLMTIYTAIIPIIRIPAYILDCYEYLRFHIPIFLCTF
jgi:hypothetical protein